MPTSHNNRTAPSALLRLLLTVLPLVKPHFPSAASSSTSLPSLKLEWVLLHLHRALPLERDCISRRNTPSAARLVSAPSPAIVKVFNDAAEALRISDKKMNPLCTFTTTNMGSAILTMNLGWMGPNHSISTACATSNFCRLNAANHIIRGEADVMLCGG